jgi:hypothetical protein
MRQRLTRILIAGWMMMTLGAAQAVPADGQGQQKPQITVKIANYARLDRSMLEEAKQVVLRIFARVGVELQLQDQNSGSRPEEGLGTLCVNICHKSVLFGLPPNTLGVAPGTSRNKDRYIVYVFDQPASRLLNGLPAAERSVLDEGTILGYAVAHEIGHVLLNIPGHSVGGVMKANWSIGDLQKMNACWVNFNSSQAAKIRAEIRRRTQDQQSRIMALLR